MKDSLRAGHLEEPLQRLVEERVDGVLQQHRLVHDGAGVGMGLSLTLDLTGDLDHFHAHRQRSEVAR